MVESDLLFEFLLLTAPALAEATIKASRSELLFAFDTTVELKHSVDIFLSIAFDNAKLFPPIAVRWKQ